MSDRRNRRRSKNRTFAYIAAAIVHVLIIAAMVVNFTREPQAVDGAYADKVAVVKAALVEDTQVKKRRKKVENDELEKKLLQQRELERIQKKELDDAKKKKAEDEIKEAVADAQVEREKAIALKKKLEEDKKKKQLADEAKKKKKLADEAKKKKKKAADEAKRKREDEARKKKLAEETLRQNQLNESIAAEEAFLADQRSNERATTLTAKYIALLTEKVQRVQRVAPGTELWRTTKVNVKLSSSGEVQSVRVVKSSGDPRYDRSVETAIYQASPLPIPSIAEDPGVNRKFQDLNLNFDMSGQ